MCNRNAIRIAVCVGCIQKSRLMFSFAAPSSPTSHKVIASFEQLRRWRFELFLNGNLENNLWSSEDLEGAHVLLYRADWLWVSLVCCQSPYIMINMGLILCSCKYRAYGWFSTVHITSIGGAVVLHDSAMLCGASWFGRPRAQGTNLTFAFLVPWMSHFCVALADTNVREVQWDFENEAGRQVCWIENPPGVKAGFCAAYSAV